MGLVLSISNYFILKIYPANKLSVVYLHAVIQLYLSDTMIPTIYFFCYYIHLSLLDLSKRSKTLDDHWTEQRNERKIAYEAEISLRRLKAIKSISIKITKADIYYINTPTRWGSSMGWKNLWRNIRILTPNDFTRFFLNSPIFGLFYK